MSCQSLVSRLEYCLENLEMRNALHEMQKFSVDDRKVEAAEFMVDIRYKKVLFDSLIQWVKVVYASELCQTNVPAREDRGRQMGGYGQANNRIMWPGSRK